MRILGVLLCLLFVGAKVAAAAPAINLGTPENYCVTYCYVRVPFTVANLDPSRQIGRVFCEFDVEVTARLPVYNGEAKSKDLHASPIGVFRNDAGTGKGDVEMSTGIIKAYFLGAKVKSLNCHL
jgi:hypothetical protein